MVLGNTCLNQLQFFLVQLFSNLKRPGGGGGKIGYFKSDDDETWCGHTMDGNLFKLVKIFDDVIIILML